MRQPVSKWLTNVGQGMDTCSRSDISSRIILRPQRRPVVYCEDSSQQRIAVCCRKSDEPKPPTPDADLQSSSSSKCNAHGLALMMAMELSTNHSFDCLRCFSTHRRIAILARVSNTRAAVCDNPSAAAIRGVFICSVYRSRIASRERALRLCNTPDQEVVNG